MNKRVNFGERWGVSFGERRRLGVELGFDLSKANRSQVSDFIAEHSTKLKPKR